MAQRLHAFDVRLIGLTREPHASKVAELRLAAAYSLDERLACLAQADALVMCAPLTAETQGFVDTRRWPRFPPGLFCECGTGADS
jgi:phosphoglycerate dehydrogenase-like enzyme